MGDEFVESVGRKNKKDFESGDGKFESAGNLVGDKKGAKAQDKTIFDTFAHFQFKNFGDNIGGNTGFLGIGGGFALAGKTSVESSDKSTDSSDGIH